MKAVTWVARISFLIFTFFWGFFALFSGASEYGWDVTGILRNSPNTLPWLVLLALNGISWKWSVAGGILIVIVGLFFSCFFNMWRPGGFMLITMLFVPLEVIGLLFLTSGMMHRKKKNERVRG